MDYQQIINNLDDAKIKDILHKLNIPFEDCGPFLVMPTYCHNHRCDDASNKLYYYKNNKIFMCYTECGTMSIFKFLKNYYEAQGIDYDWYNDIYLVVTSGAVPEGFEIPKYNSLKDTYATKKTEMVLPQFDECVLDCFVKYYPIEWLNDNISKETMDKYEIRYSISQNKIIIPHRDINKRLIGIRGRALNPDEVENVGKYMPVQMEKIWYKHPLSMNLYGLCYNYDTIKSKRICYLFESEKSVMQCDSFEMPNCAVAVCGNKFNKFQLNLLLKYCQPREIVICFDNEEEKGKDVYFNKLYAMCKKYTQYCDFSFIYDRDNLTQHKDSPSDRGEEVFKQLLRKRVKVQ